MNVENEIRGTVYVDFIHKFEDFLQSVINQYAVPKIRGEVTKDKLKRRKIVCNIQKVNGSYHYTITQKGEQIGPKFIVDLKY